MTNSDKNQDVRALPAAALNQLKEYLRIHKSDEDALLFGFMRGALDAAEMLLGYRLLRHDWRQELAGHSGWQKLHHMPFFRLEAVVAQDGEADDVVLSHEDYWLDMNDWGEARVKLTSRQFSGCIVAHYRAGRADSWNELDEALRLAIIGHAAMLYGGRDGKYEGVDMAQILAQKLAQWRQIRLA